MHPKHVNKELKKSLFKWMYDEFPAYKESRKKRLLEEEANGGRVRKSKSKSPPKRDREYMEFKRRDDFRERREYPDRDRDRGGRGRDRRDERRPRERSRDRERDRNRDPRRDDKYDKYQDRYKRRERHDSRENVRRENDNRNNEDEHGLKMARMTSEERRAMIAGWGDSENQPAKIGESRYARNPEQESLEETKENGRSKH